MDVKCPGKAVENRRINIKPIWAHKRFWKFVLFMRIGCYKITTVFSHAQTVVLCVSCSTVLAQPTGGRARLTEGRKWDSLIPKLYTRTRRKKRGLNMHTHTVAYPEEQIKCYTSHSWLDFLRQTVVGVLQARVVGDHFVRLVLTFSLTTPTLDQKLIL